MGFVEILDAPVSSTGQAYQVRHDRIQNQFAKLKFVVGLYMLLNFEAEIDSSIYYGS